MKKVDRSPWAAVGLAILAGAVALSCGGPASLTAPSPADSAAAAVQPATTVNGAGTSGKGPAYGAPVVPPTTDSETVIDVSPAILAEALDREYYAATLYERVLIDFGQIGPFDQVVVAEGKHIDAVAALFTKRAYQVPPNPYTIAGMPSFNDRLDACKFAVTTEEGVYATYAGLLAVKRLPTDVFNVFGNMMEATGDHHIPAFLNCSEMAD